MGMLGASLRHRLRARSGDRRRARALRLPRCRCSRRRASRRSTGSTRLFSLHEPPRRAAAERSDAPRAAPLREPLVRRLCIANLVFSLAVTQLETVFAFFMMDRFGYDAQHVAAILVGMARADGRRPGRRHEGARRALLRARARDRRGVGCWRSASRRCPRCRAWRGCWRRSRSAPLGRAVLQPVADEPDVARRAARASAAR